MELLANKEQIKAIQEAGHPYIDELQYMIAYIDNMNERISLKKWDNCWEICWGGMQQRISKKELLDVLVEFLIKNPKTN